MEDQQGWRLEELLAAIDFHVREGTINSIEYA